MDSKHMMVLALMFAMATGCWDDLNLTSPEDEQSADVEKAKPRVVPDWSDADMQVWHFAKAKGVHGTDFMKRTVGQYELMCVRELPEEIPPIHAGPPDSPELWVVRDGESLFTLDDAKMAPVLMTDQAQALAKIFAGELSWMGAVNIHGITQTQDDGVTTLSWIHDKQSYPPSRLANWFKVVVTATQDGTKVHSERLKGYVRPE